MKALNNSLKPMLFSGDMVRAILSGKKTQTRRVLKTQPYPNANVVLNSEGNAAFDSGPVYGVTAPFHVGDRIWVRETWQAPEYESWKPSDIPESAHVAYQADYSINDPAEEHRRWRPSLHMPKWASRITLEVTAARIQRLYEISEADAIAEGIESRQTAIDTLYRRYDQVVGETKYPVHSFSSLWESIYGKGSFDSRWVWVFEFQRVASTEIGGAK